MPYQEELANRIRNAFRIFPSEIHDAIQEKKMFGGVAFLYKGKMTVGVAGDDLMVRVPAEKMAASLEQDSVRPMDFTNRPMKEFVFVSEKGYESEEQLQHWLELGVSHAQQKLNEL